MKKVLLAYVLFILNAQADLIGWNRLRNNAAKHHSKRTTSTNLSQSDLISQYRLFFTESGQNTEDDDAQKTRRLLKGFSRKINQ